MQSLELAGDALEPKRVAAAWTLGSCWAEGDLDYMDDLVNRLHEPNAARKAKDRAIMQALEAAGASALPALLKSSAVARSPFAVRALGRALDLGQHLTETHEEALQLLDHACREHADASMRLCAVEALGSLRHVDAAEAILRIAKQDGDGDVRATACHSLLRLLQAGMLDKDLDRLRDAFLELQGDSRDRYVAAYAGQGLDLLEHRLSQREQLPRTFVRWCAFGDGWSSRAR